MSIQRRIHKSTSASDHILGVIAGDQYRDAPTPWRAVYSHSETAAIWDAQGRTVTICRREIAERIVAAVNAMER